MPAMSIPNLITIGRILLVPLTVWLIISGAYGLAFLAFVAAGVSDGVDGYIARHFDQVVDMRVLLTVDNMKEKDLRQRAECSLHIKGRDLFAESSHFDLYAAIDAVRHVHAVRGHAGHGLVLLHAAHVVVHHPHAA